MCYHVKFGNSASKDVPINIREPPKLGSTVVLSTSGGGDADH